MAIKGESGNPLRSQGMRGDGTDSLTVQGNFDKQILTFIQELSMPRPKKKRHCEGAERLHAEITIKLFIPESGYWKSIPNSAVAVAVSLAGLAGIFADSWHHKAIHCGLP
jgi:hypothetical protein